MVLYFHLFVLGTGPSGIVVIAAVSQRDGKRSNALAECSAAARNGPMGRTDQAALGDPGRLQTSNPAGSLAGRISGRLHRPICSFLRALRDPCGATRLVTLLRSISVPPSASRRHIGGLPAPMGRRWNLGQTRVWGTGDGARRPHGQLDGQPSADEKPCSPP